MKGCAQWKTFCCLIHHCLQFFVAFHSLMFQGFYETKKHVPPWRCMLQRGQSVIVSHMESPEILLRSAAHWRHLSLPGILLRLWPELPDSSQSIWCSSGTVPCGDEGFDQMALELQVVLQCWISAIIIMNLLYQNIRIYQEFWMRLHHFIHIRPTG